MSPLPPLFVALVASLGAAAESPAPAQLESTIGMEQIYYLRHSGKPLEAKPLDEQAPILLRIGAVTPVDVAQPTGPQIFELRYIGTRAGVHDLRDYLIATTGAAPEGVESTPVRITELLPATHNGDLESPAAPKSPSFWSYRTLCAAAVALWSLPMLVFLINRLRRRRRVAAEVTVPPESLEAQLRALATTASQRELTPTEQAQLERYLIRYWRECLELKQVPPERLLTELSQNAQTRELVQRLEEWLYRRPGTAETDVVALLAPYRKLAAATPARSGPC